MLIVSPASSEPSPSREPEPQRETRTQREGRRTLQLGASLGRAVWPEDAAEIEALMRHADSEMYRAKRAARAA